MKVTKYVHSCLLVESDDGRVGLIDPGVYSWESGLIDLDSIGRLDDMVITHEHEDHMYLPFIKAVTAKFPDINIVTTKSAKKQLEDNGINNVKTEGGENVELFSANHETLEPLFPPPENIGVHYIGKISHPGDSHHFEETKDVLAVPMTAPWGTVMRAAELGEMLRPKFIVPIHDWHYKDEAKTAMYDWLEGFFSKMDISFLKPVDGKTIDISV
jgi:L-ascorbate metabolism protein UlaG (beta-lactamase superfamily)